MVRETTLSTPTRVLSALFIFVFSLLALIQSINTAKSFGVVTGTICDPIPTEVKRRSPVEQPSIEYSGYIPATVEDHVVKHAEALGYSETGQKAPFGCAIWQDPKATSPSIHSDLQKYRSDLEEYEKRVRAFSSSTRDLRLKLDETNYEICKSVDLHPQGVKEIFSSSGHQLSFTTSGFVEPLLPPMRHPAFCEEDRKRLFDLSYLVHDFGAMCRKLKPTSRIVLFDMGASLRYASAESPAIYLTELFDKFGFPFDHVYAYEITPTKPEDVFKSVPRKMLPAYHWINVGVSSEPDSYLNPFTTLLDKYNEDDLVVVKLDIDTPWLEMPLARQLLEDARLGKLVDQFYFEHHVHIKEVGKYWKKQMSGTVKESLDLFRGLREKGVPAHFWV